MAVCSNEYEGRKLERWSETCTVVETEYVLVLRSHLQPKGVRGLASFLSVEPVASLCASRPALLLLTSLSLPSRQKRRSRERLTIYILLMRFTY